MFWSNIDTLLLEQDKLLGNMKLFQEIIICQSSTRVDTNANIDAIPIDLGDDSVLIPIDVGMTPPQCILNEGLCVGLLMEGVNPPHYHLLI